MTVTNDRFPTIHVGSLLRAEVLIAAMFAKDESGYFDSDSLERLVMDAVRDVVDRQAAIGIDIINDGGQSFGGAGIGYVFQDLEDFPASATRSSPIPAASIEGPWRATRRYWR